MRRHGFEPRAVYVASLVLIPAHVLTLCAARQAVLALVRAASTAPRSRVPRPSAASPVPVRRPARSSVFFATFPANPGTDQAASTRAGEIWSCADGYQFDSATSACVPVLA